MDDGSPSDGIPRRRFLKIAGAAAVGAMSTEWAFAGPFQRDDFLYAAPIDKRLSPTWVKSLTDRGKRTEYRGNQLSKIGMPVGGICAGGLYIGGDGRLWLWDIFNSNQFGIMQRDVVYRGATLRDGGGAAYVQPPNQILPFDQGFDIQIGDEPPRSLDRQGFDDIRFIGEYPVATVSYHGHPTVAVVLEAFSPFIPLQADDSGLPATLMHYTVENLGDQPVKVQLRGWMQNAVCMTHGTDGAYELANEPIHEADHTGMVCRAVEPKEPAEKRFDIPVEDWDKGSYAGWRVEGTAFGRAPIIKSKIPSYQGDVSGPGDHVVNSHATAPGNSVAEKDAATGRLIGSPFKLERNYLHFWIGGGNHPGKTCLNLIVDAQIIRTSTGTDGNKMRSETFAVKEFEGKTAHIEIVDAETGPWGNIGVGRIEQSDTVSAETPLTKLPDYGSMAIAVLGAGSVDPNWKVAHVGSVTQTATIAPNSKSTITFIVAWHFPNTRLGIPDDSSGRYYATKFTDAAAVAAYVAKNHARLAHLTRLWHATWYDSTLPYWFLDRTFANTSILATTTAHRFGTGRFYAWEGIGCCAGTCTHVWHYAQAMARIFPELERWLRTNVDYGISFNDKDGEIGARAEFNKRAAHDGQAGTVLRVYREHQMSKDSTFLTAIYPKVVQSIEFLISCDPHLTGILEGAQENTLDAAWYGKISWISSLYLAALRAGETMALEVGDETFAKRCRGIFQQGTKIIDRDLFNGEYYIQTRDPKHEKAIGTYDCCHIDQVMGQSWAWQVNLGRVLGRVNSISALKALYKYNFMPDVGPWRNAHKEGRWYAMPGDGGLVMTTNPMKKTDPYGDPAAWQFGYFNECMSGFEHQAASHMIAEGLVQEGLAVTRAIHDRYRADLRNPWNEIECSDHYSRAMASYGTFISMCGFEHHGPKKTIGFSPRLSPENFRAACTCAEGWGSYSQRRSADSQRCDITMKYGSLTVQTLNFDAGESSPKTVGVRLGRRSLNAKLAKVGSRIVVLLDAAVTVKTNQTLSVWLNYNAPI